MTGGILPGDCALWVEGNVTQARGAGWLTWLTA